jgi:hypothetical protein
LFDKGLLVTEGVKVGGGGEERGKGEGIGGGK